MATKIRLLHDTVGIPTGAVAVTQSASDNTTKVATTAYVTTALANLADSAPSTLNTLNELAAALGDDANFSTTVTNSIATKLALAGGTLTGDLVLKSDGGDNVINVVHSGNTVQLVSIGQSSDNSGNGVLRLRRNNGVVHSQIHSHGSTYFNGGNVGIGFSSGTPQDYLEINGSGSGLGGLTISNSSHNHAALSFARSSTATARIFTTEPDATHTSQFNFQTSNASGGSPNLVTAMVIDDHQNVGIGVTPAAHSSTYKALQIGSVGSIFSHASATDAGSTFFGSNIYNNSGWKYITTNEASFIQQKNGEFYFARAASGSAAVSYTHLTLPTILRV